MRVRLPFYDSEAPLGSAILGSPSDSPRRQRIRIQALLTVLLASVNAIGVAIVVLLIIFVIPGPSVLTAEMSFVNFVVLPIYVVFAFVLGATWLTNVAIRTLRWRTEGREPNQVERAAALKVPWRLTMGQAVFWFGATAFYTAAAGVVDKHLMPKSAFTIGLGGIAVCAITHMFSEFALRPITAEALDFDDRRRTRKMKLAGRSFMAWLVGSGLPITWLILLAFFAFFQPDTTANQLAVAVLALSAIALVTGVVLNGLDARATIDPIRSVTRAMAEVERGDLDSRVIVYDGTELGELQHGFNRMADGLRERDRIRDLFGRHVGQDVAEAALRRNPELGGEERTVAVFFIDLIGSTGIAATRPPQEVVELLNRFFDVVVAEVDSHDGFVNKFEGDAALAIFGAPTHSDDPAGQALAAGRAIRRRLATEVPDCEAAIGVAFGVAVAGNIGARDRFEYTVIGDPINEAARLCELAKTVPSRLAASERAVAAADSTEAEHWQLGDEVTLRGRAEPTRVASPKD